MYNTADQGGSFFSRGNADPEKEKSKVNPPKTYKEQVELYKSRNLYIEDSEYAEKTLQRINYYLLSAYGLTLIYNLYSRLYRKNIRWCSRFLFKVLSDHPM